MANRLMDALRHVLGLTPPAPPSMNAEQEAVAQRLRRIAIRQKSIDNQVAVLRADTRDVAREARRRS